MTKRVRIENADGSNHKVRVRVFDKGRDGEPDVLASEQILAYPTDMTNDSTYIHGSRYIIVDEV